MDVKKRLLLIVNPCAGRMHGLHSLPRLNRWFSSAGYDVTDHVTTCRGDGEKTAAEAEGYDMIIAVGGDGTLNEVISGVMRGGKDVPLGYIPAGSTNDFARSLGLPRSIRRAAERIIEGVPSRLDIGQFDDRNFSYIASFGAFAKTSYSVSQRLKNKIGHAAYILRGIADVAEIHPERVRIESKECTLEDAFIFGAVSNATSFGGMLKLDRKAVDFNDGKFEVMLIRQPKTPHQLSKCLAALATRNYYQNDQIVFFHTDSLTVYANPEMPWTLDGEYAAGSEKITIRNRRGAIRLFGRRLSPNEEQKHALAPENA